MFPPPLLCKIAGIYNHCGESLCSDFHACGVLALHARYWWDFEN